MARWWLQGGGSERKRRLSRHQLFAFFLNNSFIVVAFAIFFAFKSKLNETKKFLRKLNYKYFLVHLGLFCSNWDQKGLMGEVVPENCQTWDFTQEISLAYMLCLWQKISHFFFLKKETFLYTDQFFQKCTIFCVWLKDLSFKFVKSNVRRRIGLKIWPFKHYVGFSNYFWNTVRLCILLFLRYFLNFHVYHLQSCTFPFFSSVISIPHLFSKNWSTFF